jgi:hypothetical protein
MNIGVTLLFSLQEDEIFYGLLKSYVIECKDKNNFHQVVTQKVSGKIKLHFSNQRFLGIEDVFSVSGKAEVGEVVGRSTLYDLQSINQAKGLVKKDSEYSFLQIEDNIINPYVCVSILYFYEDNRNTNYTFSVLTLLKNADIKKVVPKAKEIAKSKSFLYKLLKLSANKMYVSKIKYIGIEDIYLVEEDVDNGEAFLVLRNSEIKCEEELLALLPTEVEIGEMLNDIIV